MKVFIVGGGAREHALVWKLAKDDPRLELIAAPGNPGIAEFARCVPIGATDVAALSAFAAREKVALTIVGPEAPLAAGIVDTFRAAGLPIFGPSRAAARIETSKTFAKDVMAEAGVPTARATRHTGASEAKQAARDLGVPVVIKASGLAAGKGVFVCQSIEEADAAIDEILTRSAFGDAGRELLVEEFMEGEELSLFAITDGERVIPMLPVQDHKRLLAGDLGPNTGGMGAYAPVSIGTEALVRTAVSDIIQPTVDRLRERGEPFTGLLYAGLMLTTSGTKVVEFNCRFGDPETEALLPLLASNLIEPIAAVATESGLAAINSMLEWRQAYSVTTIIAADRYPGTPRVGDVIALPPSDTDIIIFHAGTKHNAAGELVTAGGRVLAITGLGDTLAEARAGSLRGVSGVHFAGRQYRTDIGWREDERLARAP